MGAGVVLVTGLAFAVFSTSKSASVLNWKLTTQQEETLSSAEQSDTVEDGGSKDDNTLINDKHLEGKTGFAEEGKWLDDIGTPFPKSRNHCWHGKISVEPMQGKKAEHNGIKIELLGQIGDIGIPVSRVTKQIDPKTRQRALLIEIEYTHVDSNDEISLYRIVPSILQVFLWWGIFVASTPVLEELKVLNGSLYSGQCF